MHNMGCLWPVSVQDNLGATLLTCLEMACYSKIAGTSATQVGGNYVLVLIKIIIGPFGALVRK